MFFFFPLISLHPFYAAPPAHFPLSSGVIFSCRFPQQVSLCLLCTCHIPFLFLCTLYYSLACSISFLCVDNSLAYAWGRRVGFLLGATVLRLGTLSPSLPRTSRSMEGIRQGDKTSETWVI